MGGNRSASRASRVSRAASRSATSREAESRAAASIRSDTVINRGGVPGFFENIFSFHYLVINSFI